MFIFIFFKSSFPFWFILIHPIKDMDSKIKCLEMRAKTISVRKINENLLCVFAFIWKSDIFSTFSNRKTIFFQINFKSLISKFPNYIRILPHVPGHRKPFGQFKKQQLLGLSSWNTLCIKTQLILIPFREEKREVSRPLPV